MRHLFARVTIKAGEKDKVMAALRENAQATRRDEPGCHGFEIFVAEDDDHCLLLHETYSDRAALEAHWQSPHFRRYQEVAGPLLANVERWIVDDADQGGG